MKFKFKYIVIGWIFFAVLMTIIMWIVNPISNRNFNVIHEFVWEFAFAIVWILSTNLVLNVSRRFAVQRNNAIRNILILFLVGLVLSIILCMLHAILFYIILPSPSGFTANVFRVSLFYNVDKMLVIFIAIVITQHAINYYQQFREKEIHSLQLEKQLVQAQMDTLKMQLHPHFLFNTLNSIVTLVQKDPVAAESMVIRLSDFLRMTLEKSVNNVISVNEELKFIRTYLEIEKIRFQDRLKVEIHCSNESLQASIPSLLLQPLIENSIKHGVSKITGIGEIKINAFVDNACLILTVADNGASNAEELILNESGIGISNIRNRLLKMYGEKAKITFHSLLPQGIEVRIEIPFQENIQ